MPLPPPAVKLGAIDLNLLVVFDAVMQERNVTRAGERLNLSQPAMSHALSRLRHMLKDDLFVRSPAGMLPTPRAEELALPVRLALDGLQQSLEPTQFDPSKASRRFRIAVDNYAAVVMVGTLAERIGKFAPQVLLEFQPSGTLKIADLLDRGDLDLAIGPHSEAGERFSHQLLLQDEFVAVLRKNHPAMNARELSAERFAGLPHLEISSALHPTDFIDQALARRKLARRIALRAPFLSAVRILATSDNVSVLPHRVADELARHRPLGVTVLPFPSPVIKAAMIWPRWLDNQPAHRWLRNVIAAAAKELHSE
jgi:DNA-binding transcriptional LysR family regulator